MSNVIGRCPARQGGEADPRDGGFDDVVLVSGDQLRRARRLARDTLGLLLEPAGAAGLAAIAELDLPGSSMATVLTGANADPGSV